MTHHDSPDPNDVNFWSSDARVPGSPLDISDRHLAARDVGNPRRRLADATRAVLQHSHTSTAPDAPITRATELIEQAAAILAEGPHGRGYHGQAIPSESAPHGFIGYSPVSGPFNAMSAPIVLTSTDTEVMARVTYGDAHEGPPGCLHGGLIAAVFDEVLGFAQALSGTPGMTGRLEITYRSPTPLHQELVVTGRYTGTHGRKIMTEGTIMAGDRLCAEAVGTFIAVKAEKFAAMAAIRSRLKH